VKDKRNKFITLGVEDHGIYKFLDVAMTNSNDLVTKVS
jgi:hypothetical protein